MGKRPHRLQNPIGRVGELEHGDGLVEQEAHQAPENGPDGPLGAGSGGLAEQRLGDNGGRDCRPLARRLYVFRVGPIEIDRVPQGGREEYREAHAERLAVLAALDEQAAWRNGLR